MCTLVIWVWEFDFDLSNIKQKNWVDERGNDNCWFHCTICYTSIQLTSNNQNKWTTKRTQIGNNKQHFQTSNLHFNSKWWPLWNKSWYMKLTLKSFVPKSCHSKTRKKKMTTTHLKPKLKTLEPCGMRPKRHHNDEQKLLNSFKNFNK